MYVCMYMYYCMYVSLEILGICVGRSFITQELESERARSIVYQ